MTTTPERIQVDALWAHTLDILNFSGRDAKAYAGYMIRRDTNALVLVERAYQVDVRSIPLEEITSWANADTRRRQFRWSYLAAFYFAHHVLPELPELRNHEEIDPAAIVQPRTIYDFILED